MPFIICILEACLKEFVWTLAGTSCDIFTYLFLLAKLMLFSRKNGTLDSIHGFWCRPMTTQGWFRHSKSKCLWAKSWCRYSQSSNAKFVKTSLDCEMKTCLNWTKAEMKCKQTVDFTKKQTNYVPGSLKVVDSKFSELARVDNSFICLWQKIGNIFFGMAEMLDDVTINDHMASKICFNL